MGSIQTRLPLSEKVTDKILGSMQEGLIVFNSEDHIQVLNDSALQIFGFTDFREVAGKHIQALFVNTDEAFKFLMLLEKEKQLNHYQSDFRKTNGQQIVCALSASIVQDSVEGDLLKVIIIQDITERRNAELQLKEYSQKLEKNNQALDQFAYIVSHDLKAPLRAIINLSEWLYEDLEPGLSADNKKNLQMLRGRAFRMESLISGILEYSKIGRSRIQAELVDVSQLITEILDLLVPPKNMRIEVSPSMPVLRTPKIMLLQVFSNLISNAIKYNNKEQGHITIGMVELKDFYEFTVADNGPGIQKAFHETVFMIFQTLQSRDKVESTGIGLTIVKRIIEEQSGKIWIESEEGNGCRFIFHWPKHISKL